MPTLPMLDDDLPIPPELAGTRAVLARGLRESAELRRGLSFTLILALTVVAANLGDPQAEDGALELPRGVRVADVGAGSGAVIERNDCHGVARQDRSPGDGSLEAGVAWDASTEK